MSALGVCSGNGMNFPMGAGGLGLILNEKIGWREYDSVGMILIVLFGTVLIIEAISHYIRKKLT